MRRTRIGRRGSWLVLLTPYSLWSWLTNCVARSVLVNMWNHTSFPNYKSRLWDMTGSAASSSSTQNDGAHERKPYVIYFFLQVITDLWTGTRSKRSLQLAGNTMIPLDMTTTILMCNGTWTLTLAIDASENTISVLDLTLHSGDGFLVNVS